MSTTPALDTYRRVITSKRDGTCTTCEAVTRSGVDFAAVDASSKWFAYCANCAGSYAAQVAGLVKLTEAAATTADADVLAGITLPDEVTMMAVMSGNASKAQSYDVVLQLRTLLTVLRTKPVVTDARVEGLRAIAASATAAPRDRSFAASLVDQYDRKGSLSDKQWAAAERMATPSGPVAAVEVGLYVTTDGTIYKAYITQNDRLGVKVLHVHDHGDGTSNGTFEYVQGGGRVLGGMVAANEARLLTQAEATAFGRQHSFCVNCARDVEDDRSIAAGYGATCASNLGWWYPSTTEAAIMLNRATKV